MPSRSGSATPARSRSTTRWPATPTSRRCSSIPGQTESWWGYEAGAAAPRGALPGLRRRPARPGPLHAHARPLHARQHGQRPRALHRRRDRPAHVRERPLVGRRAVGLALGLRAARSDPRRALRGSAALRLRGEPRVRSVHPPGRRRDVRALEQVPRRPVERRRLGRHGRRRAARAARAGSAALFSGAGRRGAAAEPEGVRPGVGARLLDGDGRRELRPRADAREREGPRAADAPLPRGRRDDRAC